MSHIISQPVVRTSLAADVACCRLRTAGTSADENGNGGGALRPDSQGRVLPFATISVGIKVDGSTPTRQDGLNLDDRIHEPRRLRSQGRSCWRECDDGEAVTELVSASLAYRQ
jgi:hypothetical protein